MLVLLLILTFFAALRFIVVLANLAGRQWLRPTRMDGHPTVSILIPARNEEENISSILSGLVGICQGKQENVPDPSRSSANGPRICEILVYDDQSTDQTVARAEEVAAPPGLIRVIRGGELPAGWLGKNHACHRLALEASGDWLLFLDADVQVTRAFLDDAVGYARKKNLKLLSVFPKQVLPNAGVRMVVPLMNWILVSLLPLILVRTCRWTSFSAANGQFMLFEASTYRQFRWHERVKSDPVEDIRISRLVKKNRLRTATLLSAGQVSCTMYASREQALNGFARNIGQFFGNSVTWMLLFVLLTTLLPVFTIAWLLAAGILYPLIGGYFILILSIRVGTSLLSRQHVLKNLLYWWPQQLMLLILAWKSIRYRFGGTVEWKGRQI